MPTKRQLESDFKADIKRELKERLPGCFMYDLDPTRVQGIPDLLVLHEENWGTLETKRWSSSAKRPNQEEYVERFDDMSFSAFINPQNREEVMNALQETLRATRSSRVS